MLFSGKVLAMEVMIKYSEELKLTFGRFAILVALFSVFGDVLVPVKWFWYVSFFYLLV